MASNPHETPDGKPQTILVGLSGPSSSGKTTLARLLRSIFNVQSPRGDLSLFILHQDDFYKTDAEVPIKTFTSPERGTRELQDWDCVESLDLPLFHRTLEHIRDHGSLPPDMLSKEDQNSVGESGVSDEAVDAHGQHVQQWWQARTTAQSHSDPLDVRICIMDGFLLYPSPSTTDLKLSELYYITSGLLDPRLFLPATRSQMVTRRAARSGYVTLEGFWTDPPGYVEDVVWPNYAQDHGWLYVDGQAEGAIDEAIAKRDGILVAPGGGSMGMGGLLDWGVEAVKQGVDQRLR